MSILTPSQYFKGSEESTEVTDLVRKNADKLLAKVSTLLSLIPLENVVITSGFRTSKQNSRIIGASPTSLHMQGLAIDLHDPDKTIGEWCASNLGYMVQEGLYMESLTVTHKSHDPLKRWTHLQIKAPRSRNTIFLPF